MMSNSRSPAARAAASAVLTDAPAASNTVRFWVIVAITVLLDLVTKALAVEHLVPRHMPHEIIGNVVRFTLAYNPGAAFGMHLGPASRWIFAGLSVVIVGVLLRATGELTRTSRLAAFGVPVIVGGAIGNLLDRIRLREGVVDFIDIGIGTTRFWTFNVADTAVTIGAVCLVLALWREDQALQVAAKAAGASGAGGQGGGTS
ncbi:signal peptidase II [Gemmatimonas sp.]|uniref:signal peptidase II n=1 Tax=Gemmatimonas sp. TaxID=1962908 RepID=UPI0027B9994F|nr:signal peptidase II [Gemmatimonas sp.]